MNDTLDYLINNVEKVPCVMGPEFDRQFWEAYLADDVEQLNRLAIGHWPMALKAAKEYTSAYGMSDRAPEAFQEAILGLLHAVSRYHLEAEKDHARPWSIVSWSWTQKYAQQFCLGAVKYESHTEDFADAEVKLDAHMENVRDRLNDALERLSDEDREILCRNNGVGYPKMSLRDLAAHYGVSLDTMRRRINEAKRIARGEA